MHNYLGFPEISLFSEFTKNTYSVIGELEKYKDFQRSFIPNDLNKFRTININHNHIYLACAIKYFTTVIFRSSHELEILRKLINEKDFSIIRKQTIPKHFWILYNSKNLKKQILNLLERLQNKNKTDSIQDYVYKIVNEQPTVMFIFVVVVRFLVSQKIQEEEQSIFLIGNEQDYVIDFTEDARGNLITLLAKSLKININIYTSINDSHQIQNRFYGNLYDHEIHIWNDLCKHKILCKVQKDINKMNNINKQNILNIQIKRFDLDQHEQALQTQRKMIKQKICHKCGRIKVQRFCICRKLGKEHEIDSKMALECSMLKLSSQNYQII